jgi:hypothetical protein
MWSPFGAWQYLALRDGAGGWPVGAMAPAAHLKKKKKKQCLYGDHEGYNIRNNGYLSDDTSEEYGTRGN